MIRQLVASPDRGAGWNIKPVLREAAGRLATVDHPGQKVGGEAGLVQDLGVPLVGDAVKVAEAGRVLD